MPSPSGFWSGGRATAVALTLASSAQAPILPPAFQFQIPDVPEFQGCTDRGDEP